MGRVSGDDLQRNVQPKRQMLQKPVFRRSSIRVWVSALTAVGDSNAGSSNGVIDGAWPSPESGTEVYRGGSLLQPSQLDPLRVKVS